MIVHPQLTLVIFDRTQATSRQPTRKAVAELTQADLIMEALETEDVNRASLLAFYAAEEDRRAQERIASMRYQITGPRLTWISRLEGVDRKVHAKAGGDKGKGKEKEAGAEGGLASGRRRLIEVIGEAGREGWTAKEKEKGKVVEEAGGHVETQAGEDEAVLGQSIGKSGLDRAMEIDVVEVTKAKLDNASVLMADEPHPVVVATLTTQVSTQAPLPTADPSTNSESAQLAQSLPSLPTPTSAPPLPVAYLPGAPAQCSIPAPPFRHLTHGPHARAYLILDDFEGTVSDEMAAYFGTHWGTLKPSRRVARAKPARCVLTGREARYRDPVTGAGYADLGAYERLGRVGRGEFGWAQGVGAWVGVRGEGVAGEVERRTGGGEVASIVVADSGGLGASEGLFEVGALPPLPPLPLLPPVASFGTAPAPAQTMF